MIPVLRIARADLRRFSKPTFLLSAIGLPGFFGLLVTALVFNTVGGKSSGGSPPGAAVLTLADLNASGGYLAGVNQAFTFLGVIAVTLAAMSIATDYSQGTLRNLLVRQPKRATLLAGKLLALFVVVSCSAIAATATGTVVAHVMASGTGATTSGWQLGLLVGRTLGLSVGLFGWAVIGALVATIFRSVPAAIGAGIGWALPVETVVGATWKAGKSWFPGGVFQAIASAGNVDLPLKQAITVGLGYLFVAIAAVIIIFQRREVTA
jgi:ABC-2 type transport system permease protein